MVFFDFEPNSNIIKITEGGRPFDKDLIKHKDICLAGHPYFESFVNYNYKTNNIIEAV